MNSVFRFLEELFAPYPRGEGLSIELRAIDPTTGLAVPVGQTNPRWFSMDTHIPHVATYAEDLREDYHVFVGVLPRVGQSNMSAYAAWLWLDIDVGAKPLSRKEVVTMAQKERLVMGTTARFLVGTGTGIHLYYPLEEIIDLRDDKNARIFKSVLRRSALAVGGAVHEVHSCTGVCFPSCVLRLPGSLNHKYNPPRYVRLAHWEDTVPVSCKELDSVLPYERKPEKSIKRESVFSELQKWEGSVPNWVGRQVAKGWIEGGRNTCCWGWMKFLIYDICIPREIVLSLALERARNSPGKDRFTDREVREQWERV